MRINSPKLNIMYKACMKAADGNLTKIAQCTSDRDEMEETIKSSNGGSDVTAEMAEAGMILVFPLSPPYLLISLYKSRA